MTTLNSQPKGNTMSVKDNLKAIPSKLKKHWSEKKGLTQEFSDYLTSFEDEPES